MNHYILFEFNPGCKLTDETKDRLLDTLLIDHFSGGLRELFSPVLENLHEQSWLPLPNEYEYDYDFAECFKYDCQDTFRLFADCGLSGRCWVTDDQYDAPPSGETDAQERCDRNVIEFGPGIVDCYARRGAAQLEHDTLLAAWSLIHKLRTVQDWFSNGGSGDLFDLYHQLGPNFTVVEDKDRFREVCKEMFSQQGLPISEKNQA